MEGAEVLVREGLIERPNSGMREGVENAPTMALDFALDDGRIVREAVSGRFTSSSWMPYRASERSPAVNGGAPCRAQLAKCWNLGQMEGGRARLYRGPGRTSIDIVDFFCGCGGLSLGMKQAAEAVGLRPVFLFAADSSRAALDIYCRNLRPLRSARQNVEHLVDYRLQTRGDRSLPDLRSVELSSELTAVAGRVDVFLAGPPCEGNSNLNNRTRRVDDRNELYLDAVVAGIAVGARVIVVENVPAVKRSRQDVVDRASTLLAATGYRVDDNGLTLTASDFGTPQERCRHFLIASRSERAVRTSDFARLRIPAPTVAEALEGVVGAERRTIFDEPSQLSDENLKRVRFLVEREEYDLPDDERPDCHRLKRHNYVSVYGRMRPDRVAPTITTGFLSPGRGRFTHPFEARSLTPREGARLQGFGADFEWMDQSDALHRCDYASMIGSAVPPQLGFAVGMAALSIL